MEEKEKRKRGKKKARTFLFSMRSLFNLNTSRKVQCFYLKICLTIHRAGFLKLNIAGFLFILFILKSKSDPCSVITITTQAEVSYYIVNPIRKYGGRPGVVLQLYVPVCLEQIELAKIQIFLCQVSQVPSGYFCGKNAKLENMIFTFLTEHSSTTPQ